jgi:hypothetical protein
MQVGQQQEVAGRLWQLEQIGQVRHRDDQRDAQQDQRPAVPPE